MIHADEAEAPNAVTKVSRDLTAVAELAAALDDQAEHKASDPLMPGGRAMASLGHVANLEAWENRNQTTERTGKNYTSAEDEEDEDHWLPLQKLLFWSEDWRREHGYETDQRPTLASEANFIRWCLNWAWDNEPHFEDFARDINAARRGLEDLLYAGRRAERTRVPCISDDCERMPRLIRVYGYGAAHDHYKCPACKTRYDQAAFARAKLRLLASEGAERHVPMQDALAAIDRPERTFRKWLRFWYVRSYREPLTGTVMVWWPDVREMDLETPRRNRSVA